MERSKLRWEDVIKYEEVPGYGGGIWYHKGQYYFVAEEGGIATKRVVYELSEELFKLLESGERSMYDIHYKLQEDCWTPTEEEKRESRKKFILKGLTPLIGNPSSQELFTEEELEELIPLAEKIWLENDVNVNIIMNKKFKIKMYTFYSSSE